MSSSAIATDRETPPSATDRALIVSSDGHAAAEIRAYRPYLPSKWHEDFDAFCAEYDRVGMNSAAPESLAVRIDDELVQDWIDQVVDTGRLRGISDPTHRIAELDREGVTAEVLFPDIGQPFELYPPVLAAQLGYERSPEMVAVANQAHNRWLVDFCSEAPQRFAGLAVLSFDDIEAAVKEIRWAKSAGLRGIVLPNVDESRPFFHERHEPIWNVLEELEMPVNTHPPFSAVTKHIPTTMFAAVPDSVCAVPLIGTYIFSLTQQILSHMIWGGVFERHPGLQMVLSEQGSGWTVFALQGMDYSWEQSYLRRNIRDVIRSKPSEYFQRQCHLGSSIFSFAEANARYDIGVDKIAIGMDYPHHEGTWGHGPGHVAYLQATLGAAGVPRDEARAMIGENALRLWKFDRRTLEDVAAAIGPTYDQFLSPPDADEFPRGDVHKPLALGQGF
jgi:predicted TIM-barrel fold metal-dependent hydrolase